MKKGLAYGAFVLLAYLVFLVASFPADRVYAYMKDSLEKTTLYGITGTVWSGAAKAAESDGRVFRTVRWGVRPWSVVLGRVDIRWSFDNGDAWGSGVAGLALDDTIKLRSLEALLPVSELQSFFPRLPAQLNGTLSIELDSAEYSPQEKRLSEAFGVVTWNNATVTVMEEASLGNFNMTLETNDDGITGTLTDEGDGPLSADGLLLLKPDNAYQFNATFAARDPQRRDLVQGLRLLGRPDAQGAVKVDYSGKL